MGWSQKQKKERGKKEQRQERDKETLREAKQERKDGLTALLLFGVHVFFSKKEWEDESIKKMRAWNNTSRHTLLSKGPGFRTTPGPLREEEQKGGVLRAIVRMILSIRFKIMEFLAGPRRTVANKWEAKLGVAKGCFKKQPRAAGKNVSDWEERLKEEWSLGVSYTHREEGMPDQTLTIHDIKNRMETFEGLWTCEPEPDSLAQKQDEDDGIDLAKNKKQGRRGKKNFEIGGVDKNGKRKREKLGLDNLSEAEYVDQKKLTADLREWQLDRADKGGAVIFVSRERWKEEARKHTED